MANKYKKIEREYVLSDSTVNEYGFRLLTSGYQLADFQKNPIGYYMHRREDGIVLKWEDLRVEEDRVLGVPVINLSNERGAQTCDEAENGFLNAASVGHIVVLEYSTDPEQMLPGQTGPTVTKWYNKECSLVDIPGNCNALTRLYDEQENELNLVDMRPTQPVLPALAKNTLKELCGVLQLADDAGDEDVAKAVGALKATADSLLLANGQLLSEQLTLQQKLEEAQNVQAVYEVVALLDRALEDRKLTVALKEKLAVDYATNPAGLKELLGAMPAYRSITEHLSSRLRDAGEEMWEWDDYEHNDPAGKKLKALRADDPEKYRELFERKFKPENA